MYSYMHAMHTYMQARMHIHIFKIENYKPDTKQNSFMPFWSLFLQKKYKNTISDPQNGRPFLSSHLFEVKFTDRCLLPPAMSLQSFARITKTHLEKSAKMCFQTFKMTAISRGQRRLRSNLWTKCLLTLAMSLPIKLCWINQNRLEKSAKMWLQTLKMAAITRGRGRLRSNSQTKWSLPLAMSLVPFE